MAKDEDKTTINESIEGLEDEETPKGSKIPKKLILFGGMGLGVVVLGVVLALFVLRPMMSDSSPEGQTEETAQTEDVAHEKPKPKSKPKASHSGDKSRTILYAVENIVVNPAGTGGTRFLSLSLGFELGSQELARQFEDREPIVRDALITILSSKTVAQLTDARQKEIIRYQIKKRLAQLLRTKEIEGVYYTDFVMQ